MPAGIRKQPWSLCRWARFADRCRWLRQRFDMLSEILATVPGIRAPHVDAMLNVDRRLVDAMIGLERIVVRQHPEADHEVMSLVHGYRDGARDAPPGWPSRRGRRDGGEIPSRELWTGWGRCLKAYRAENSALLMELQETAGVTKVSLNRFVKVERAIDALRCKLDSLVCLQHPDWRDFSKVFYGPRDPGGI